MKIKSFASLVVLCQLSLGVAAQSVECPTCSSLGEFTRAGIVEAWTTSTGFELYKGTEVIVRNSGGDYASVIVGFPPSTLNIYMQTGGVIEGGVSAQLPNLAYLEVKTRLLDPVSLTVTSDVFEDQIGRDRLALILESAGVSLESEDDQSGTSRIEEALMLLREWSDRYDEYHRVMGQYRPPLIVYNPYHGIPVYRSSGSMIKPSITHSCTSSSGIPCLPF